MSNMRGLYGPGTLAITRPKARKTRDVVLGKAIGMDMLSKNCELLENIWRGDTTTYAPTLPHFFPSSLLESNVKRLGIR